MLPDSLPGQPKHGKSFRLVNESLLWQGADSRPHWNSSDVPAVDQGKNSNRTATMRSPYVLAILSLLLTGCPDIRDDDQGYGVRGPAAIDRDHETLVSDLSRACREGDRQSCASLDRAIQEQQRKERYQGPQPSLS